MPDYFTLPELREMPQMGNEAKFSNDRCEAVAAALVSVIEREVGTSFVARTVTDEVYSGGANTITLRSPYVLSVTSLSVDGTAVTDPLHVADGVLRVVPAGTYSPSWLSSGYGNVTVTYVAGYSTVPPADVKEQALKGTRSHLLATSNDVGMNERRTSLNTEQGTISFLTAGEDNPTGYPEVDSMIARWKKALYVPKVA